MIKLLLLVTLCTTTLGTVAFGQTKIGAYNFTEINSIEHTPVRDQHRSGTCWAYAAVGLIEAEIIRLGGKPTDISEMWIVRNAFYEKTVKYIRMHGKINISEGGNGHDVFNMIQKYGIVPENIYPGNLYGTQDDGHVHAELATVLTSFANAIISNPNKELSTAWNRALNNILDAYFGTAPEQFKCENIEYTPMSYMAALKIIPENYITITSYSHHPFYTAFALEIPDNWAWGLSYNVPLADYVEIPINALTEGYTVAWDSDVSEKGFKHSKGLALFPETDVKQMEGSERERWEQMSKSEAINSIYDFDEVIKERRSCDKSRQRSFDNYTTTDDHLMLLTGLYKDQFDNIFFKVKNSWNTENSIGKGYFWTSIPFYEAKTISITLNKDALPEKIKNNLNIN